MKKQVCNFIFWLLIFVPASYGLFVAIYNNIDYIQIPVIKALVIWSIIVYWLLMNLFFLQKGLKINIDGKERRR